MQYRICNKFTPPIAGRVGYCPVIPLSGFLTNCLVLETWVLSTSKARNRVNERLCFL